MITAKKYISDEFPTEYSRIIARVAEIDPQNYGSTRNFIDGAVTKLSPYLSRGVISTKFVMNALLERNFGLRNAEKLLQELAWRDYWQQVWVHKGVAINSAIRQEQNDVNNHEIPTALLEAETGIEAIDKAIIEFYETGYLHNHIRMYIAAIACNMGKSHWKLPAKWMYYHLLDGDWASNALSWQWVAGTNSNKKYVANQENINKYCYTQQKNTWLDVPYETFTHFEIPPELQSLTTPTLETVLPECPPLIVETDLPIYVYTTYNLDPNWGKDIKANRVLILEPKHFENYPISQHVLSFILNLAHNINGLQLYVGNFDTLNKSYPKATFHFKEHPLTSHFKGTEHPRDWMFTVKGDFRSFFGFWKKCKKELK